MNGIDEMRDDFSASTKENLAKRVGYKCSNPDCRQLTCGPQKSPFKSLNVGVAAHITAASPDGPRYDNSLTAEKRKYILNGIWLCQKCAKLVDNDPIGYTVEKLNHWKSEAEKEALQEIEGTRKTLGGGNLNAFKEIVKQVTTIANKLGPDYHAVEIHSEQAERTLNLLIKQRSLTPDKVQHGLISLVEQITVGDLIYTKKYICAEILYWASRVHASKIETLPLAREYLRKLCEINPEKDTRIIDALILETEGDTDGSLRILRDIDDADGRSTFFVVYKRKRGDESALVWFDEQPDRDIPDFFNGIGWANLAITLAQKDRWAEAAERLLAIQDYTEQWPDLAFVEGVINTSLLLPDEIRPYALEMGIFDQRIRTSEGSTACLLYTSPSPRDRS